MLDAEIFVFRSTSTISLFDGLVDFSRGTLNNFMKNRDDYDSDFDMWIDMSDEMNKTAGYHPPVEEPQPQPSAFAADVLGINAQDTFYDYLGDEDKFQNDDVSGYDDPYYAQDVEQDMVLQEEKIQNPIYPDSVGPDNKDPKPAWVSDNLLKEIEALKNRLFKVENAMARMGQGKKWSEKPIREDNRLFGEIKSLKNRIDRLSNQIGVKDEPSPWQIKRD